MKNKIYKKCIYVLIVFSVTLAFAACVNKEIKLEDKNIAENSNKDNTELNKPTKESTKNINLDSWVGDYIYTEYISSRDYTKFYEVFISKENNNYSAKIKEYDEGEGVYSSIQAKVDGDANRIDFIFNDYLPDETNTNRPYNAGDVLLSFAKKGADISTHWGKIVPTNDANKVDGVYFKIRKNSEGYLGHWYTSLPYTGGNSTTIEIKEMSNTHVNFHLYISRTYSYDGTNIKLENNIAKFVDNGDYKTTGTIEFIDNSIIVTIEESELPILKQGKTVFNYKVNEFDPIHITPDNGATDVDLDKGIEIDFGRRISETTYPIPLIKKTDVQNDQDIEYLGFKLEIKGNKLIILPDYDKMKSMNQVIEPGQKYELIIPEGQYVDDVGNINNEYVLEFTTKK